MSEIIHPPVSKPEMEDKPKTALKKHKITSGLKQFFEDTDGKFSATRLVLITWAIGTFVIWSYISIQTATLADLPNSVVQILGIVLTGKVIQKFGESEPNVE